MNGTGARSAASDNMSEDEPGIVGASDHSEDGDVGGLFGSGSEGDDGGSVANLLHKFASN